MTEPIWINVHDAITLHDQLIALHGGATGIRDEALLQSALALPQQLYAYADSPDTIEMATAYTGVSCAIILSSMATNALALWSASCFWN